MRVTLFIVVVGANLFGSGAVFAQAGGPEREWSVPPPLVDAPVQPAPSISQTVDKGVVAVGESFELTVSITNAPAEVTPKLPDLTAFEVVSTLRSDTNSADIRDAANPKYTSVRRWISVLRAKRAGQLQIGPATAVIEGRTLTSNGILITVQGAPEDVPLVVGETRPATPPPAYVPQGEQKVPYPYSPYGPAKAEEPPAEVGLIITEVVFGALTAGGYSALMSLLVLPTLSTLPSPLKELLFVLALSTIPVGVAQAEVPIANGSAYYVVESWPAMLAGLFAEGIILGLYYVLGGFSSTFDLTKAVFIIATHTVLLPAAVTVAINVAKRPRLGGAGGGLGALVRYDERRGFRVGIPLPQPVPVFTSQGVKLGVGATLAVGRF